MTAPPREAVLALRAWVAEHLGLWFDDAKLGPLGEVLARRAARRGIRSDRYVKAVLDGPDATHEVGELASDLTVSESYFFRHAAQLDVFAEHARARLREPQASMRVLSAACSTGEEPYTLAMILLEAGAARAGASAAVVGIDVDRRALARAAAARYAPWSLRETPPGARARWFRQSGRDLTLAPAVRRLVRLVEGNLAADLPELTAGAFDVVFCRNVLMYLTPQAARDVVARLSRALAPGGLLFLGHADTLRGLSDDFETREAGGAFYHVKRRRRAADAGLARSTDVLPGRAAAARDGGSGPLRAEHGIRRSAGGVGAPIRPSVVASPPAHVDAPRSAWSPSTVLEHLRHERWADATAALEAAPDDTRSTPELALLRAVVAAQAGDLERAELECERVLAGDARNPGAHHLLGLCCESAGDVDGAIHHHRTASALDPGFALPRLHLGLLARRRGDRATAREELTAALAQLDHEDPSRILLFGGGLERAALHRLCRMELEAAGGPA